MISFIYRGDRVVNAEDSGDKSDVGRCSLSKVGISTELSISLNRTSLRDRAML